MYAGWLAGWLPKVFGWEEEILFSCLCSYIVGRLVLCFISTQEKEWKNGWMNERTNEQTKKTKQTDIVGERMLCSALAVCSALLGTVVHHIHILEYIQIEINFFNNSTKPTDVTFERNNFYIKFVLCTLRVFRVLVLSAEKSLWLYRKLIITQ